MSQPPWAQPTQLTTRPYNGQPDVDAAVAAIARYDGDIDAAARSLNMPSHILLQFLSTNPEAPALIAKQMRTLTLLHSYQLLDQTRNALRDKIDDMAPADVGKTYTSLLQAIAQLTDSHETNNTVNYTEVVMRALPPEARVALKALMDGQGQDDPTDEPDWNNI
jgi:hypothetical protein